MIGNRIKEIRKDANLTQQELSNGIITRSYLSQIEKGAVQPSFELLVKLSSRLNCSVDDFFHHAKDKGLILSQLKKEIKTAEMNVNNNVFDKVETLIQKRDYLEHEDLDNYYTGILFWIHGKYHEKNKDYNKAIEMYDKSISLLEEGNYSDEILRSLGSLGHVTSQMNENEKALTILNKAYKIIISEQIYGIVRISILANLGIVHGKLNEYYSALNFLQEAKELNEHIGTYYKSGDIAMALGICNMKLKRYADAKLSYECALKFFKLNENIELEAGTYTNLGILFLEQKDYKQAERQLKTAIELYQTIHTEEKVQMNVEIGLAQVYFCQGDLHNASLSCFDILKFKEVNKYTAEAYEILGDICSKKQSELESSLCYYDEAKKILFELHLPYQNISKKLADIYAIMKKYKEAINFYKESF